MAQILEVEQQIEQKLKASDILENSEIPQCMGSQYKFIDGKLHMCALGVLLHAVGWNHVQNGYPGNGNQIYEKIDELLGYHKSTVPRDEICSRNNNGATFKELAEWLREYDL